MTCGGGHTSGVTLNAFAGIGRGDGTPDELLARVMRSSRARDRWRREEGADCHPFPRFP